MSNCILEHVDHPNGFTQIDNRLINDADIAGDAFHILVFMISKPARWQFSQKSIMKLLGMSQYRVKNAYDSLQKSGYLKIERTQNRDCIYHISQRPQAVHKPEMHTDAQPQCTAVAPIAAPHVECQRVGIQPVLVRLDHSVIKNKSKDKDLVHSQFERLWISWPNKKNKLRSKAAFMKKAKGVKNITDIVNILTDDIQKRLAVEQLGFREMMLSTYLNGERYQDEIQATVDQGRAGLAEALSFEEYQAALRLVE